MGGYIRISIACLAIAAGVTGYISTAALAEESGDTSKTEQQIQAKEQEIAELNRQIQELSGRRDTTAAEADIIASQVRRLNNELRKAELELEQTALTLEKIEEDSDRTEKEITVLRQDIEEKRQHLRSLIRLLYERQQDPFIFIFLDGLSLSKMLAEQETYAELQRRMAEAITGMREQEQKLIEHEEALSKQQQELHNIERLLAYQKSELASQRQETNNFLQSKKEEQLAYEHKIQEARQAQEEIKNQIFTLQGGSVEVSLNNAFEMARYASSLTGVRPALLLGILKVESNVGNNLGSGVFPQDMQVSSREPFLRITSKLGIDPHTAPISRGGGAIGPAQFMPRTWEGIEARLEQLMGKSPVNPYEMTDAFVAAALFLADRGAAVPGNERVAVGRYLGCQCNWYIDRVMAVAQEYERGGI